MMEVIFDDILHRYFDKHGTEYPSVSMILRQAQVLPDYTFLPKENLQEIMNRGKQCHKAIEDYLLSDDRKASIKKTKYFNSQIAYAMSSLKKYGFRITKPFDVEKRFIYDKLHFAGTADLHQTGETNIIADYKTGSSRNKGTILQLALYVVGLNECDDINYYVDKKYNALIIYVDQHYCLRYSDALFLGHIDVAIKMRQMQMKLKRYNKEVK